MAAKCRFNKANIKTPRLVHLGLKFFLINEVPMSYVEGLKKTKPPHREKNCHRVSLNLTFTSCTKIPYNQT